jgi:hypothetical protein
LLENMEGYSVIGGKVSSPKRSLHL